jgi:hypothetical protein
LGVKNEIIMNLKIFKKIKKSIGILKMDIFKNV